MLALRCEEDPVDDALAVCPHLIDIALQVPRGLQALLADLPLEDLLGTESAEENTER